MTPRVAAVALPLPSPTPYQYAIPTSLEDHVLPGARVVVPVRSRELVGIVLELRDAPADAGRGDQRDLKPILLAPDPAPLLPEPLLDLAQWISRYYAAPIGVSLRAMLPGGLWGRSRLVATLVDAGRAPGGASRDVAVALERTGGRAPASAVSRRLGRPVWDALQRLVRTGAVVLATEPPDLGPAARTERIVRLTRALPTLLEREETFRRARKQREAYEALDGLGGAAAVRHLRERLGFSPAVLRGLVERGVARFDDEERLRDPFAGVTGVPPAAATAEQREAISSIEVLEPGTASLLFGVTGSGKTLVYLEALRRDVEAGRGAIVLVPEISLTPQTIARVRGTFGDAVAVLHSGLSEGERADAWRALATGMRRVAVGARSAVFAPVRNLAAVIVDEEHDHSYKNGEAPRYHARDVALRRAAIEGARVILGSATPSLDTWARRTAIAVLHLPTRIGMRPLPPVELVDLRSADRVAASGALPWSAALDAGVQETLDQGEQVLLLLNRRGFAHFLQCGDCGRVWECPSCSVALTVHRGPSRLRCHHCGHDESVSDRCPACHGTARHTRGVGTQALERWLAERYPRARLARMDADTTSRKWSHGRLLDAVGRGDVDLLFGTQMIAKGLDFPGVTLVGVVDADTGLHLPDFRAAERTFQLIAQVAGRAGRGPRGGRVLVQTRNPDHPALGAAARHDYEAFADGELARRRAPPYPPHVALVNVVVSGEHEDRVAAAAVDVTTWLQGLIDARAPDVVELIGPAPAPLARVKRRWRWHALLRAEDRRWIGRIVRYAARRAPHAGKGPVRVIFDRDPVSLL